MRAGLSQEQFAGTLDIPLPFIIELENERVPEGFDMEFFLRICYFFDIANPADLIRRDFRTQ